MSSDKINLEEILKRFSHVDHGAIEDFWFTENVIKAMKEACRQTLELAAENADMNEDFGGGEIYNITEYKVYNDNDRSRLISVNKQSILDTIKQVE